MTFNDKLAYVGLIVFWIARVIVAILIFGKLHNDFETIIVSLLILIYVTIDGFQTAWAKHMQQEWWRLKEESRNKDILSPEQRQSEEEVWQEVKKTERIHFGMMGYSTMSLAYVVAFYLAKALF